MIRLVLIVSSMAFIDTGAIVAGFAQASLAVSLAALAMSWILAPAPLPPLALQRRY